MSNDVEYEQDAALNQAIWKDAIRYMFAAKTAFIGECGSEKINTCTLSIGLLLWSVRLTKAAQHVKKEEFLAQCENIWDSGLSDLTEEDVQTLILTEDLEKETPNGHSA